MIFHTHNLREQLNKCNSCKLSSKYVDYKNLNKMCNDMSSYLIQNLTIVLSPGSAPPYLKYKLKWLNVLTFADYAHIFLLYLSK